MKIKIVYISLGIFLCALLGMTCGDNPFDSPVPGRLTLHFKLDSGPYASILLKEDRLDVLIQYIKGYVDEQRWSYIVDKDSFKVLNLFNIDGDGYIMTPSKNSQGEGDEGSYFQPVILSDCGGVFLPPFTYTHLQIKIVLQDSIFFLGGIRNRIFQKEAADMIVEVPLEVKIREREWIERILYLDLKNSLERSTAEPDLFNFKPKFYIE